MPGTDTEALVAQLDPNRDYGDLSFADIKDGIARGAIEIEPGHLLPVLKDAGTHKHIKGTGRPPGSAPHEWSRTYVREFLTSAASDQPQVARLERLMDSAFTAVTVKGDMKALELLLKYGIGDHREVGADAGSRAVDALMQLASNARTERVIQVNQ